MTQPRRIQRRRVKGWRKPEGAVNVARPSKWGNPYRIGDCDAQTVVDAFETWLSATPDGRALAERARRELRGKDLMCYCSLDAACHADVLLRIANEEPAE